MELTNSFTIPASVDDAWSVLLDVERIAPCMPGAKLERVDGDEFEGAVKVKLGAMGLTYLGKARFIEKDADQHRAVIEASAREARGSGTAKAHVTTTLVPRGEETEVQVVTSLNVTGKPAQFGRGVMADVAERLIDQFADRLRGVLSTGEAVEEMALGDAAGMHATGAAAPSAVAPVIAEPAISPPPRPETAQEAEPLDLLAVAGGPMAKRAIGGLAALLLLGLLFSRVLAGLGQRRNRGPVILVLDSCTPRAGRLDAWDLDSLRG